MRPPSKPSPWIFWLLSYCDNSIFFEPSVYSMAVDLLQVRLKARLHFCKGLFIVSNISNWLKAMFISNQSPLSHSSCWWFSLTNTLFVCLSGMLRLSNKGYLIQMGWRKANIPSDTASGGCRQSDGFQLKSYLGHSLMMILKETTKFWSTLLNVRKLLTLSYIIFWNLVKLGEGH